MPASRRRRCHRSLSELGIERIHARSPQAKGRIERAFLTLQERLRLQLRLAGASTLEEANRILQAYIPRYNQQFAVPPAETKSAFRPIPPHIRLEHVFCWKHRRMLNPGYVIHYEGQTYQVAALNHAPTIPLRTVVDVLKHPDGRLFVAWNGNVYALEPAPEPAALRSTNASTAAMANKNAGATPSRRPAKDHPWRKPAVIPRQAHSTISRVTESLTSFR